MFLQRDLCVVSLLPFFYVIAIFAQLYSINVFASITPRTYFSNVRTPQLPNDPIIIDAANFAVSQLRTLSDSGIYTTLTLAKIHAAATELGDFHYVIHLQITLTSPHFRSKRKEESFDLMVLESKPYVKDKDSDILDTTRSIAIDRFPEMDENAIERFWVNMMEERRQQRRDLFEKWEKEENLSGRTEEKKAMNPFVEMKALPHNEPLLSSSKISNRCAASTKMSCNPL
ncbi:uncharacterized protein PHALS_09618 [Plasmopara halstedii]|uniref:Uncharacterized protein n=1 Tax=Plasmopara halstedii TaxID=4781 RepID=A0A0P1AFR5_PLAHL|nr:uncharacterized protein PHALS_09618 [Plasmopara halstedii]CEG39367.1 hypothetical protein PHALS_09618 [Plasmopara halstedii]|eukprot:XP_024575736.1 hypothetical protein PHALS_09618 [Plasmopara halstedii]